jgi:transcriptional antiterminator RfaH
MRTPDDALWFVVQTHLRQEKLAVENLERQADREEKRWGCRVFEPYLPMWQEELRPKGQPPRTVGLPYFPRYLFVRIDMGVPGWTGVYSTRGVSGVLPSGRGVSRTIARLVADLRRMEDSTGFIRVEPQAMPCKWREGDVVSYGAFTEAVFAARVDATRCRILVSGLFGRDSRLIEVDLADIESR